MRKITFMHIVVVFLVFGLLSCSPKSVRPDLDISGFGVMPRAPEANLTFEQMIEMEMNETGSYLLGPGDSITIYVYGEDTLTRTVTIEPNGRFTFPLIGEVLAKDRRIAEVIQELDRRLNKYFKGAKTDIIINQFSSNQFVVLGGGIKNPGMYTLTGQLRLLEAIALAGGFSAINVSETDVPGADLKSAYLSRGNHILPIDFTALVVSGEMKYNIRIQPKDTIYIPMLTSHEVYVMGAVASSRVVPLLGHMTITKAITTCGGFTPDANQKKVYVIRHSKTKPQRMIINVKNIMMGDEANFMLEAGDIVFVKDGMF